MQAESTKGKSIKPIEGEFEIAILNDSIQKLQYLNQFETNQEIIDKNNEAINEGWKMIQRIRLAQLLALERAALMEIVKAN